MTTVAYRAGVLAADSLCTGAYKHPMKKLYPIDGGFVGVAGSLSTSLLVVDWLQGGDKPDLSNDSDFEALIIRDGKVFYLDNGLREIPLQGPYHAVGSGMDYAMGAMAMGATAEEAVKVARKFDNKTGGAIKKVTL